MGPSNIGRDTGLDGQICVWNRTD